MRYPNKVMVVFDQLLEIGRFLGIGMVFLSMILLCAHVAMRYIFNYPLNWVVDISTIFIFLITFLGAPWLLREEGHVSLDILTGFMSHKNWGRLQAINSLVCAFFCAVITWYGMKETLVMWQMEIVLDMPLALPKWPFIAIVPLGTFLLAIQFLRRAQKFWKKFVRGGHHHQGKHHRADHHPGKQPKNKPSGPDSGFSK